jgi:hypothetical protein
MQGVPQAAVVLLLLLTSPLFGQTSSCPSENSNPAEEPSRSLADVARQSKNPKSKAKTIVTDDDLPTVRGPFPALVMDGMDNSMEVVAAMKAFSRRHPSNETEKAVHDWYDRYDDMLAKAIKENIELKELDEENNFNGYTMCQETKQRDYRACVERRQMEIRSAHQDVVKTRENTSVISRIQQAFARIRANIAGAGMNYDWFKIRTTNNIGYY